MAEATYLMLLAPTSPTAKHTRQRGVEEMSRSGERH